MALSARRYLIAGARGLRPTLSHPGAMIALRRVRLHCVVKDAIVRLRAADGFSHARALAFHPIRASWHEKTVRKSAT